MDDVSSDDSLASNRRRMNQYNDNNNVARTSFTIDSDLPLTNVSVTAVVPAAAATNVVATNSTTTGGMIAARNVIDNLNDTARYDTNIDNQLECSDDINEVIVEGN